MTGQRDVAPVDTPLAFPTVESTEAFRSNRVIWVRTDRVRMPDGDTATRDVVVHPGAVGVIALDDRDRVLLVQQYRHPVRHQLWEPPAGLLDQPGEDPLAAAQRELFEEAHHEAGSWQVLLDAFTSPGMTSEAVRIYLAREVRQVTDRDRHRGLAEEQDMPVRWWDLHRAAAAILAGQMHNPMAVMGVLAAAAAGRAGFRGLRPADAPWPARTELTTR